MSNGMLIQLNLVVIFVMIQNADAVIHKVIAWHLDTLLPRSVKVQITRISDTGLDPQVYNKYNYTISLMKTPFTDQYLLAKPHQPKKNTLSLSPTFS